MTADGSLCGTPCHPTPPGLALLGSEFDGPSGRVALDDHGTIVGHVGLASGPVVLDGWMGSGLAPLLAGLSDAK
jgi:hypothetical protein